MKNHQDNGNETAIAIVQQRRDELAKQLDATNAALDYLTSGRQSVGGVAKRRMSPAARRSISVAMRKRWAKKDATTVKRTRSPEAIAKFKATLARKQAEKEKTATTTAAA